MADERQYSHAEERQLALQLQAITTRVYGGELSDRPLRVELLLDLHQAFFGEIRSHAGRIRQLGRGSEFLTFGPNRSVSNRECSAQLERASANTRRALASASRDQSPDDYDEIVLDAAARLHAEVVRIHPFEDGNGRSSRLLLNVVLVAYGLAPIEVETIKAEYTECLNHYFQTKELEPLMALLLSNYLDPGKLLP